jgi:hypothetical protein
MRGLVVAIVILSAAGTPLSLGHAAAPTDQDIVDSYQYMLSRWLVMRQEGLDLDEGFKWNEIIHRKPGGVTWANPNLDVAYSEAWIAVDESSCTLINLPEIRGRYYTVQVLNGWGEVTANINERNFPEHPFGSFGLCLKGTDVALPEGVQRIDLPNKKSRILLRVELGPNPDEAIALQKQITMKATSSPTVEGPVVKFDFPITALPGVEAFDKTTEVLASEPDINEGMAELQSKALAVGQAAKDLAQRAHVDEVIRTKAIPAFVAAVPKMGATGNGWMRPRVTGNYGSDYQIRSIANFAGIWANSQKEVVYFMVEKLDGSKTYTQTYPKDALPASKVGYFWSVIAVDSAKFQVIPNPLSRFLLNKESGLELNADGSLTLAFAPRKPTGLPEPNWLPTPEGQPYNLTYRFYGPSQDIVSGAWFPPPLTEQK